MRVPRRRAEVPSTGRLQDRWETLTLLLREGGGAAAEREGYCEAAWEERGRGEWEGKEQEWERIAGGEGRGGAAAAAGEEARATGASWGKEGMGRVGGEEG